MLQREYVALLNIENHQNPHAIANTDEIGMNVIQRMIFMCVER